MESCKDGHFDDAQSNVCVSSPTAGIIEIGRNHVEIAVTVAVAAVAVAAALVVVVVGVVVVELIVLNKNYCWQV